MIEPVCPNCKTKKYVIEVIKPEDNTELWFCCECAWIKEKGGEHK